MKSKIKNTNRFLLTILIFHSLLLLGCGTSKKTIDNERLMEHLNATVAPTIQINFKRGKGYLKFLDKNMIMDITPDHQKGSTTHTDMEMAYSKSDSSHFKYDPDTKALLLDIIYEEKAKSFSFAQIGCFTRLNKPETYIKYKKWREPQKIEIAFNLSEINQQTVITFRSIQLFKTIIEEEKDAGLFMHQEFMDKLLVEQLTEFFKMPQINNALASTIEDFSEQNTNRKILVGKN